MGNENKPFEATQSRLARARREGDVARSQELCALCAFAIALAALAAIVPALASTLQALLRASFAQVNAFGLLVRFGALALVPIGAAASASTLCAMVQTGGLRLAWSGVKFERLSPGENLRRILSRETAVSALRGTLALICAAAAMIPAAQSVGGAALHGASLGGLAAAAWNGSLGAAAAACAAAGLFAFADYALQVQRRRRRLRMSYDELRRDRKEQDGDPIARGRRRTLHRQFTRGSLRRVREAAFVVCNPEHVAVALAYNPPIVAIPRVLVRAAGEAAARVREIACAHDIPLVHNVELARMLYASAEPGDYIPTESYIAVAQIVASLHKTERSGS